MSLNVLANACVPLLHHCCSDSQCPCRDLEERLELEHVWGAVVAIVPERDLVPRVGPMSDDTTVQPIHCRKPTDLDCHYISNTACELHRMCSDPRNRTWVTCMEAK